MGCKLLFVCTGNTCRSPLAEGLAKKIFDHSVTVRSAGLEAWEGSQASYQAIEVGKEFGVDLTGHRAFKVTFELLKEFDWIIPMTRIQERELQRRFPALANRVRCLGDWNDSKEDIQDPWGGSLESYRASAVQIEKLLRGVKLKLLKTGC